ncbi:DUF3267 domain-containing protein [Lancefieldella rimae]|uniref:DUF3267 domain-containing protein n=1 Tax=Lancefieldella rimae TaxID=1383 RepID=UPI003A955D03
MPKIIWKGNMDWNTVVDGKQEWDRDIQLSGAPQNAVVLKRPENIFQGLAPYFFGSILLCFLTVFLKRFLAGESFFDFRFLPVSFLFGFCIGLPIHELFHALSYPAKAKVYIGVSIRQLRAFYISANPIKRNRFIFISIAPALLGIFFQLVFLFTPVSLKWLITISMIAMFFGLISPAPDYRDVFLVVTQVPKGAYVQPSEKGYVWYKKD